jgi:hypothetical protein
MRRRRGGFGYRDVCRASVGRSRGTWNPRAETRPWNAGITGGPEQAPTTVDPETMLAVVATNVNRCRPGHQRDVAPRRLAADRQRLQQRRLAHPPDHTGQLRRSGRGGVRAVEDVPQRGHGQYAKELAETNILINATCHGFVATDLNGFGGTGTAQQGAATPIRLATLPDGVPPVSSSRTSAPSSGDRTVPAASGSVFDEHRDRVARLVDLDRASTSVLRRTPRGEELAAVVQGGVLEGVVTGLGGRGQCVQAVVEVGAGLRRRRLVT